MVYRRLYVICLGLLSRGYEDGWIYEWMDGWMAG